MDSRSDIQSETLLYFVWPVSEIPQPREQKRNCLRKMQRVCFTIPISLCLLLALQNVNVWAESILFSDSSGRPCPNLTHTVFHGEGHHDQMLPDMRLRGNDLSDLRAVDGNINFKQYGWKYRIVTTIFWIGEVATECNPVSNIQSAWDACWLSRYGGEDDPIERQNFLPARFTPAQNPFYVALPYNDVDEQHSKPEAAQVIPWFRDTFVRDGQSVCKDHWVAIRHGRRICYAQWEDVGPFQTDHWQYVFGSERPRANRNHDSGLDVSPAVRDYLEISGLDVCDWKFVNVYEVPNGPWVLYGDNNTAAQLRHRLRIANVK
jgi:hypothetical protein